MTPEDFAARHPILYHMAEPGSWNSIRRHGLLSTTALLDLFEIAVDARRAIESARRPESVQIRHPQYGIAVIRDQKPMSDAKLRTCLIDMLPREWYETLNSRVYFWPTEERLLRLLRARAYRAKPQLVITVSTSALLNTQLARTRLSPINSGSTVYNPVHRGRDTFLPLSQYPEEWWRKRRLAELAVDWGIKNVADLVLTVEDWSGTTKLGTVWQR